MSLNAGMHLVGVICLALMAGLSIRTIVDVIRVDRHHVVAALFGRPFPSPAASVAPLATAIPQLPDDEAVDEPAIKVAA